MPKRILSWQPKFINILQMDLLARSYVPHFFITNCDHIENKKLPKEKFSHFSSRQKIEIYFPHNTFVSHRC